MKVVSRALFLACAVAVVSVALAVKSEEQIGTHSLLSSEPPPSVRVLEPILEPRDRSQTVVSSSSSSGAETLPNLRASRPAVLPKIAITPGEPQHLADDSSLDLVKGEKREHELEKTSKVDLLAVAKLQGELFALLREVQKRNRFSKKDTEALSKIRSESVKKEAEEDEIVKDIREFIDDVTVAIEERKTDIAFVRQAKMAKGFAELAVASVNRAWRRRDDFNEAIAQIIVNVANARSTILEKIEVANKRITLPHPKASVDPNETVTVGHVPKPVTLPTEVVGKKPLVHPTAAKYVTKEDGEIPSDEHTAILQELVLRVNELRKKCQGGALPSITVARWVSAPAKIADSENFTMTMSSVQGEFTVTMHLDAKNEPTIIKITPDACSKPESTETIEAQTKAHHEHISEKMVSLANYNRLECGLPKIELFKNTHFWEDKKTEYNKYSSKFLIILENESNKSKPKVFTLHARTTDKAHTEMTLTAGESDDSNNALCPIVKGEQETGNGITD